jgi:glycerophosphoryl diester phosphodiesterase
VVIHNPTLDKTTGVSGNVTEKTLQELKKLDAGAWFDPKFSGETIPTLAETLDILTPLKQHIYLDVKPHCHWSDSQVDNLVKLLIDKGWQQKCIVSSFNPHFVEQVRQINPGLKLGYIVANTQDYQEELAKAINQGNSVMISEYHLLLENPDLVEQTRNQGVDIVVWTVDDIKDFQALLNLGIKRIITNSLVGT